MRRASGRLWTAGLLVVAAAAAGAAGAGCVGGPIIPAMELRHDRPFKKAVLTWFVKADRVDGEADAQDDLGGWPFGPPLTVTGDLEGEFVRVGAEISRFYGERNEYAIGLSFGLVNYGRQRFAYDDGMGGTGIVDSDGWSPSAFVLDPGLSFRARLGGEILLRAEWHATVVAGGIDVEEAALLAELRLSPGASLSVGWRSLVTRFPDDLGDGVRFEVAGPTAGLVVSF